MLKKYIFVPTLLLSLACTMEAAAQDQPTRDALQRGRDLFGFGRWSDARTEFIKAREGLRPEALKTREDIDFYLTACAVELQMPDAEGQLKAFMRAYPNSTYANEVNFSLGSLYCAGGDMAKAREYYAKTHYKSLDRRRREQYDVRMGYVEFSEGNYNDAYAYFDRIDPRSEFADHALYYKSYMDYAEGRTGRAKQGFTALTRSDAYGELAPYYLLQIEFREGNYRYVVDNGDRLARKATPERRAELERVIAESWFHLDDYNKTLDYMNRLREDGRQLDRESCYLMGFSLYRTAHYTEAVEWLRKACGAKDAVTQNASYHLADCYLRTGEKRAAMHAFAMAADETFDGTITEDALFNYAKLQYELGGGAFNGAINVLNRYVEEYPSSKRADEARTLLIAAYYNSRDYDAAYRAIKSSAVQDADTRAALQKITYFRALEAYSANDMRAAQNYLAESAAINVSPKYSALNTFWQGEIAYRDENFTVAAMKYNAYLKRAPRTEREYSYALYNLGYCAFMRGDMAAAESSFGKFVQLYATRDGYRADALNRLGDVAFSQRRFDEAISRYGQASMLSTPEMHYSLYKRAETLGVMGRTEDKLQTLRRIIADAQGDYVDAAAYELGRTYISQEKYREGARQLEKFVEEYPSSQYRVRALSDLGLAWLNLGDKQKSLKYYDMVVNASPQSSEARQAMQGIRDIYVSSGDVDSYFDYAEKSGLESDLTAVSRDSLSFAAAQKLYLADRHADAEKSLRSYVKSYPKGYYMVDALYYLSDCYLRSGQRDEAIESLQQLVGVGAGQYAVQVLEKLSSMTFDDKRYREAADAYRRLYDVAPTKSGREKAMQGYVDATLLTGDASLVRPMAEDVISRKDVGATALRDAKFALAEQLRKEGDMKAALVYYKQLAKEVRSRQGSASAYYVIEETFRSGNLDATEKAVFAYSERSPQSYWLAKSFILLGEVYQKKGDNFQARATWQSVVDGYTPADDGIVAEARERINKLN